MTDKEMNELDRRAATEVMGWKIKSGMADIDIWDNGTEDGGLPLECHGAPCFSPTRNIKQAWECLEKSFGKRESPIISMKPNGWEVVWWGMHIETASVEAETAAIAIVLACLQAANDGSVK